GADKRHDSIRALHLSHQIDQERAILTESQQRVQPRFFRPSGQRPLGRNVIRHSYRSLWKLREITRSKPDRFTSLHRSSSRNGRHSVVSRELFRYRTSRLRPAVRVPGQLAYCQFARTAVGSIIDMEAEPESVS